MVEDGVTYKSISWSHGSTTRTMTDVTVRKFADENGEDRWEATGILDESNNPKGFVPKPREYTIGLLPENVTSSDPLN